jgi:hypothetical protein
MLEGPTLTGQITGTASQCQRRGRSESARKRPGRPGRPASRPRPLMGNEESSSHLQRVAASHIRSPYGRRLPPPAAAEPGDFAPRPAQAAADRAGPAGKRLAPRRAGRGQVPHEV